MAEYRSVSQLKEYQKCAYAYYLHRIENAWERPAAWLPQGLAVHEAAEAWERSGRTMSLEQAQDVFKSSYATHTNRLAGDTPNFEYWFSSGPYKGETDAARRLGIGLEQVEKYIRYYMEAAPEQVIWITPSGQPAIELGFDIDLDGVRVKGFIDQVISIDEHGEPIVRDIKTGNKPGDDFQLAVYAVAMNEMYGTDIKTGDYWMGRQGKPTKENYDLEVWTKEKVSEEFHKVDQSIRAGDFPASPEADKCRFCSVASACGFRI
ncbi:PD-(D/E)XK nuclease family protein [Saccharopolyspora indica]|uniref:RecB family exonuclease n=1 Tax=Saccharopolyspora indica TaxID=1229659 RepID=UPI0022EABB47|nr:PD-(D/E)XK nuclease family protein [Saccharopolyspora indica]MDA3643809.1 PD-(D/E)XK nuclease family protein [Saccharopolyspora indica]